MTWFLTLKTTLLDIVYPPACVACGKPGAWWCETCRERAERLVRDPCPSCLNASVSHHPFACAGDLPFTGVVAAGFYHSPPLRDLIQALKYQGVTAFDQEVEAWLKQIQDARGLAFPWQSEKRLAIQSMPLAHARERDRGFNQAEWLAERVQHAWAPQSQRVRLLERRASDMPQASIEDKTLREHNIKREFVFSARMTDPVLLVDDVITTGATAAEAARVLLSAGAPRVYLAALALGA